MTARGVYGDSLERKKASRFREGFGNAAVADLMKPDPIAVQETARVAEIAEGFLRMRSCGSPRWVANNLRSFSLT